MRHSIIAFAGAKGSGKTAISQAFAEKVCLPRVGFGDYVRAEAARRGLPTDVGSLQALGETLITEGWEQFCGNVLAQANWKPGDAIIIDGIRHLQAITTLRKLMAPASLFLVFVDTNPSVRLERLKTRDAVTQADVLRIEKHSTEADTKHALPKSADLILDGTQPLQDLLQKLTTALNA